jgi:hypothetical protein
MNGSLKNAYVRHYLWHKTPHSTLKLIRNAGAVAADSPAVDDGKGGRQTRNQKRRHDELNHTEEDDHAQDAVSAALEKEHLEATKVKNIMCIQIGNFDIDTWYYSPYP